MGKFLIKSSYKPIKDQLNAIENIVGGINTGNKFQVLLGVTGSGKTFTVANVIERLQKPTLIISHNKTLAGQLYQEFRDHFPDNAVSYFVSYYDYYQPESYIPQTDTYIEKDSDVNEKIDKLRLAATTNLLTRSDVIVIASVSCIYNLGSPVEHGKFIFDLKKGNSITLKRVINKLIDLQYERSEFGFYRGTFRLRGNSIDVFPAYQDTALRIQTDNDAISTLELFEPISGKIIESIDKFVLYPAKHYITNPETNEGIIKNINIDLEKRVKYFLDKGKPLEAHRIKQRVTYDLNMIRELGYVKGIENYSVYFDGRKNGQPPYTLLDYFNVPFGKDWLVVVDESHMTFPQIRGMYNGDVSRKQTHIDYGFRLPAALDNRPLKFEEFLRRIPNYIATSATPSAWEISIAKESCMKSGSSYNPITEQLIRPTGIPDPRVSIKPTGNQVNDVIKEIDSEIKKKRRTLVTTLTKKTAKDLSEFLKERGVKVHYLHSDIHTLERTDILDDLRRGNYDAIIGVNLLREGLDLPEVALVAILDADKEGFLRSDVALIQTMGRAARHANGRVILYADRITGSIERAVDEVKRRRAKQISYNKRNHIKPVSISKPIRDKIIEDEIENEFDFNKLSSSNSGYEILMTDTTSLTPIDKKILIGKLKREMKIAANNLDFELATLLRDKIQEFQTQ